VAYVTSFVNVWALRFSEAIIMKSSVLFNIAPYCPLKINRRFGETCLLLLQGLSEIQVRYQRESGWEVEQGSVPKGHVVKADDQP
jgi:hypothetical protein